MQQKTKKKAGSKSQADDKILRVALYCRVSSEEQVVHGYSLAAQEETLLSVAKERGLKVVKVYMDEGFSARKPIMKRKVVMELLEDVKAGRIDRILFTKLDRWTRNVSEFHAVQAILDKHNVTWEAILESYSTVTADARLKLNIMLSVAENESDRLSERVRYVFNSFLQRKEVPYPEHVAPYGYKVVDKHLVKDPESQDSVEYFFQMAALYSVRRAGLLANEKFDLTRTYSNWYRMTKNTVYYGEYKGVSEFCDPYITKNVFDKLNDNPQQMRKAKNNRFYQFSGLVRCAKCGCRMTGKYTTHPRTRREYNYYRCFNGILHQCSTTTISEKNLEKYLLENIRGEMESQILEYEIAMASPKMKQKKSDVAKLKERLRRITVSYHAGNLTDEEYLADTAHVKQLIEEAEKAGSDEPKELDVEGLKQFLSSDFETVYHTLTKDERRRLWMSIIDEIMVDGRKIAGISFKA